LITSSALLKRSCRAQNRKDGILNIEIPKKEEAKAKPAREIEIV